MSSRKRDEISAKIHFAKHYFLLLLVPFEKYQSLCDVSQPGSMSDVYLGNDASLAGRCL